MTLGSHLVDLPHSPARTRAGPDARICALALSIVELIEGKFREIHHSTERFDPGVLCDRLQAFVTKHPMRPGSRTEAALHEAGHLVAYQAGGRVAGMAEIRGTAFSAGGWGGSAWAEAPFCTECSPHQHVPREFYRDARDTLAGPLSEDLLGGGDALNNIAELMEARLLSNRAAELQGCDPVQLWRRTLRRAVALVEFYQDEIRAIAEPLERRKRIMCFRPSMRQILQHVKQSSIGKDLSDRGKVLFSKVNSVVMELAQ